MPPLLVQGVLMDAGGEPLAGKELLIALADFYGEEETFAMLDRGLPEADSGNYSFCTLRTDSAGAFSCRLPGESRYIGFMTPLKTPSDRLLRSFVVGFRVEPQTFFAVEVSGPRARARALSWPERKLTKPDRLPFLVSSAATRSSEVDVLQLIVRFH